MKPLDSICLAIASAAIIATPVLAADQQEPATVSAEVAQIRSEQASVRGDWPEATRLDEQSYRESPSISNEFNLATDYTRTGQPALAIPLYQDVAEHGGDRTAGAVYNDRTQASPPRERFNYAEEAVRRLDAMTDRQVVQARYYGVH